MKSKSCMIGSLTALVCALVAAPRAQANSFLINFDNAPAGTEANLLAPAGISYENGIYEPDLDAFGDPILGSDRWRIDVSAPPMLAEDPESYGYGPAPSPSNALNALFQTALMLFDTPVEVRSFNVTLDNSIFGDLSPLAVEFYSSTPSADVLLASIPIDQSVPLFKAMIMADVVGVSKVVLPSGAFYDDFVVSVPDAGSSGILLGFGLAGLSLVRRRE